MNSRGSLPVFFLAWATSCGSTFRLQLAMSTVPFSSAAIPVPDPPPDTSIDTVGSTVAYSSAHAWARLTMVSDPVFWITAFSGCVERAHPIGSHARAAASNKPAGRVTKLVSDRKRRLFIGRSLLVAQDRLDEIPDVIGEGLERLLVRSPNLFGRTARL